MLKLLQKKLKRDKLPFTIKEVNITNDDIDAVYGSILVDNDFRIGFIVFNGNIATWTMSKEEIIKQYENKRINN